MPRQPSSSKALNLNPPVSQQKQKQVLDPTAQKIKDKVPHDRPAEMEIAALRLPQGDYSK
jgi:hypothetical protein